MPAPEPADRATRTRVVVAVLLTVLVPLAAAVLVLVDGAGERAARAEPATAVTASPAAVLTGLPPLPPTPGALPASTTAVPVRLQIPAIGVDTRLDGLGLDTDGRLATPPDFPTAGWYAGGVRPGDPGPAIVAGHVDSYRGPAVFFRLDRLRPGDTAVVTRADGTRLTFVVESAARYPKADFPTSEVYGPTPTPVLELITCTGVFDRAARSYEDNLVVTAALQSR